jgi:glycerol-3-phosphate acyltransferase PlsX
VFLGLNGTVIKSHGSADATGVAAALGLAHRLGAAGFAQGLAAQVAPEVPRPQIDGTDGGSTPAGGAARVETAPEER